MKVKLVNYSNISQDLVSVAAKLCYSEKDIDCILKSVIEENDNKFIEKLLSYGHESPLEHVSFSFAVEGVSRSLLAQITRHRIASFSVKSQRYVGEENFSFIIPPKIEAIKEAKEIYLKFMQSVKDCYCKIKNILNKTEEKKSTDNGLKQENAKKKIKKSSIEDARYVLPNACETKFIVTMNARSLLNFFKLRCCNRAQWEIRNLAYEMLKIVSKVAPDIFKKAGPSCILGKCVEGEMCCGEFEKVKEKIARLKKVEKLK